MYKKIIHSRVDYSCKTGALYHIMHLRLTRATDSGPEVLLRPVSVDIGRMMPKS